MKELSIEEKAKRYDEAIKRAKQHCADYVVETIFPELKESEDERIRKALLEMVHDTTGDSLWVDYNVHKEDAIDWLENQGKHSNFLSKIQVGDKVTRNEDGVLVNLSQLKRVAKPSDYIDTQKQGEQKPVPKFEVGDVMRTLQEAANGMTDGMPVIVSIDDEYYHCTNELIAIKDQDDYEYLPMNRRKKPAWSEEDEDFIERLLDVTELWANGKSVRKPYSTALMYQEWLKSLRPRSKNEWDKNDELNRQDTIRLLTDAKERYLQTDASIPKCIKWLENLSSQSQWKPSEEQMVALKEACDEHWEPDGLDPLYTLWEQLKAL